MYYQVPVKITKQEDGLWRIEAPDFPGCFVDAPTLAKGLSQIYEGIAMMLDLERKEGRPLPEAVKASTTVPLFASIPVFPDEVEFYNVLPNGDRVPASAAARERLTKGQKPFGGRKSPK